MCSIHALDAQERAAIDSRRMMRIVARRLDADKGAHARITTHLDLRAALDGADFAVNMVQVGMHAATLTDSARAASSARCARSP
jgi:alpha-galactosidase